MTRGSLILLSSLCIVSVNSDAGSAGIVQVDFSEIEAKERRLIVEELTIRLDTKPSCTQNPSWNDGGSGADLDGHFFIPSVSPTQFMIGGYASRKTKGPDSCVITVSERPNNLKQTLRALVAPADWIMIWKDKGSGAHEDGSMWVAIPPDRNYKCIGSIPQLGYNRKPNLPNYRCVHSSLTELVVTNSLIWSDKGSGADKQVSMFRLPNTGSFVTVTTRINQVETYDLKANAVGEPEPQVVDVLLQKKMKGIKAGIQAKINAESKQNQLAEEEKKKKVAKKLETQRLAKVAKQKQATKKAAKERPQQMAEQQRTTREIIPEWLAQGRK